MSHDTVSNKKDKSIPAALSIAGVTLGIWVLYESFAGRLIVAMYQGKSLSILNKLIKYQHKKPVQHYLDLADRLFYEYGLAFGVGLSLLMALGILISRCQWRLSKTQPGGDLGEGGFGVHRDSIRHVVTILVVSLAARMILLPLFIDLPLAGDEVFYWLASKYLAKGDFVATTLHPPLWSNLLALPAAIYDDPISGRILSVLIGTGCPIIVYLLASIVFNKRTAVIGGLLYALYPVHVCYSHYLWAELLVSFLCLLSVYFFMLFVKDPGRNRFFFLSFAVAGVALLAKEFAGLIFAGLLVAVFFVKMEKKKKIIPLACLLFAMPVFLYSLIISCATGRIVILSDASVRNPCFAAGLNVSTALTGSEILTGSRSKTPQLAPRAFGANETKDGDSQVRDSSVSELLSHLSERSIADVVKSMKKQIYNLWTPNSFPIARVAGTNSPETWSYGISHPEPWVYLLTGGYICVLTLGIAGICLSPGNLFKVVVIVALASLCSLSVFTFLCSRFRLPFMFIFVIYTAHFLARPGAMLANLRNPIRACLLLILMRIFWGIVFVKMSTVGAWG